MKDRGLIRSFKRMWVRAAIVVLLTLLSFIPVAVTASAAHISTGTSEKQATQGTISSAAHVKSNCANKQIAKGVNGLCLEQTWYAGYSAQLPARHWALGITGTWTVPEIASCPQNILNDHPRTAVWVGQWSTTDDMAAGVGWLPQIGTASRCQNGKAVYSIAWEMQAQPKGYGNAAQYVLDCPGNKIYKLCAEAVGKKPSDSMAIHPGDQILAFVGILLTGNQTEPGTKPQPRKFQMYLDDMTTGVDAVGYMVTAKGAKPVSVNLPNIIEQSGVIVEDEPSCSAPDIFITHTCKSGLTLNGLAKFTTPIKITAYIAQWKPYKATVNEWVMQRDYLTIIHNQLAQCSAPSGSMTGPSGMSWTATWLRQY